MCYLLKPIFSISIAIFTNLLFYPISSFAYDIIGPDFNTADSLSKKPYLAVDLKKQEQDPAIVADSICRILGFVEGVDTENCQTNIIEIENNSTQTVVDFLNNGLTAASVVSLFGSEKRRISFKIFTKLECKDNKTGFPSPSMTNESKFDLEKSEIDKFEQNKKIPKELLASMYHNSQVLAMGESNHRNYRILEFLVELLHEVGQDPHLKFIMIERDFSLRSIYETASTCPIDKEFIKKHLSDSDEERQILKGGNFWAQPFLISKVLPLIQEINRRRPPDNPIKVVPIDSESLKPRIHPLPVVHVAKYEDFTLGGSENCGFGSSWDRESETQSLFISKIAEMRPHGKAIVVYHLGHLAQGIEARLPKIDYNRGIWLVPDWHPISWLGMVFQKNPELREKTKIVLFDEKDVHFAPKGTFTFVQRLAKKYSNESFGFPLAPFRGVIHEKGMSIFSPEVVFRKVPSSLIRFDSELADLADAVIWSHDADKTSAGSRVY